MKFFLFLITLLSVKSDYIRKDYFLIVEKGHSYSFQIHNNHLYTKVLVYCSSENAMKINDEYSPKFNILKYDYYTYEKIYEIELQSKVYSYTFRVMFLPKDINAELGEINELQNYISLEIFNDYNFNSMSLIFINSKLDKSIDSILNLRLKAGNPIQAYYIPLSDDLDFDKLTNDINYKSDAKTGDIFYPKDDNFIIKVIGSTYDFMVEYFSGISNIEYSPTIHLFSNQQYIKEIQNRYSNYKIDYITGSNEDCEVDIGTIFNNSEYTYKTTLSKSNKRIILEMEELSIISKNCDAVLTIIPNYIFGYKAYKISQDFHDIKLPPGKICLLQIPKPQDNIRTFRVNVQKPYDFGTTKACPDYYIGLIPITGLFIEEPVIHEYIYVGGKMKYYDFLNPYYYSNEAEKNDEEYYIIISNYCYGIDPLVVSVYTYTLDENNIGYLAPGTDYSISFYESIFTNYYLIDGPKDNKKILSYTISPCQSNLKFYLLTDYNTLGYSSMIYGETTGYITLDEKIYQKDYLNLFFRNNNNDYAYFKFEYHDIIDNYTTNFAKISYNIKVENSYNEKITVEFYPLAFDEDVKYVLYIIQTTNDIVNMCNFVKDSAKYKAHFDIGIINVPQKSSNYLLKKEIKLGYGSSRYTNLKVSILAKTSKYGNELMYPSVDFEYNPKYKDDDEDDSDDNSENNHRNNTRNDSNTSIFTNVYFYIGIGGVIIIIVAIIIYYIVKKKNSYDKFDLPKHNSKLINE